MPDQYTTINVIIAVLLWLVVISLCVATIINGVSERKTRLPPLPQYHIPPKIHRTTRIKQNGGTHTQQEWEALCAKYNHRCVACNRRKILTKDHIVPVILGGTDSIDNLQPLCRSCNSAKGTKTVDYRV